MVVNTKADRQHAIASALELPSTWAKKVDYYNLGVHMANVLCRFIPMHDSNSRKLLKLFNEACLLLNNGRIKKLYLIADNRRKISAFNICRIHILYILHIGMLKY